MPRRLPIQFVLFIVTAGIAWATARADEAIDSPKQRAVEAMKAVISPQPRAVRDDSIGNRGPPPSQKPWDEMTPQERDDAGKRRLLNSGGFGTPGIRSNEKRAYKPLPRAPARPAVEPLAPQR